MFCFEKALACLIVANFQRRSSEGCDEFSVDKDKERRVLFDKTKSLEEELDKEKERYVF